MRPLLNPPDPPAWLAPSALGRQSGNPNLRIEDGAAGHDMWGTEDRVRQHGPGRHADAERWYLRAIELGEQLRYYAELGKWLSNLANV